MEGPCKVQKSSACQLRTLLCLHHTARVWVDVVFGLAAPEDFSEPWKQGADGASFHRLHAGERNVDGTSTVGHLDGMQSRRQKRNFCSPQRCRRGRLTLFGRAGGGLGLDLEKAWQRVRLHRFGSSSPGQVRRRTYTCTWNWHLPRTTWRH